MAETGSEAAPEPAPEPAPGGPQVRLLDIPADGYCDPVTGGCLPPGATSHRPAAETTVVGSVTVSTDSTAAR